MNTIIVDLESYPIDDAAEYLDPLPELTPPDLDEIQPAKNLVDPVKVAADLEKRRLAAIASYTQSVAAQAAQQEARLAACALDPDLLRIVALGWQVVGDPLPTVITCRGQQDERDVLELFWREARDAKLVTFRGLNFDLPVLQRRSQYLYVPSPVLNLDRYRTPHVDLYQRLTFNGAIKGHSLQFYLARFGIPYEDVSTGKDIAALVKAEDWAGVAAHCASDVKGTAALAQRLGLLQVPVRVRDEAEVI
jgi:predicted PolB exonuclease-like 3'-5' exonuclease